MKKGIHPEYQKVMVRCGCGNTFETRSTAGEIHALAGVIAGEANVFNYDVTGVNRDTKVVSNGRFPVHT